MALRSKFVTLVLLFALQAAAPPATAEKRLALLIGNQGYAAEVGPLRNPYNDIRLVGTALAQVGFDIGTPLRDASRKQILLAVYDFAERLKAAGPGAIGFFYYAGHGIAVGGENILVPVTVKRASRPELAISGVKLTEIVSTLNERAPQAVHFVVFDACRSNLGGMRGSQGFVPIDGRPGMLIAFSTAPGNTAWDEGSESGPYATALADEFAKPGALDYHDLFFEVRQRVAAATGQQQIPWTRDGLLRRVYFKGGPTTAGARSEPASSSPLTQEAAQVWAATKGTKDKAVLEAFIARYGDTFYAELARVSLKELQQKPSAGDTTATVAAERKLEGQGEEGYDGSWRVIAKSKNCFNRRWKHLVVVKNGRVVGGRFGAQRHVTSGQISASGQASWRLKDDEYGGYQDYSGHFHADKGSGKFSKPGTRCKGTFTASRVPN